MLASRTRSLRLAIAGGGTGGHLVPGLNLCRRTEQLDDVLWLTSGRKVEDRVLHGIDERLGHVSWERVVLALEPRGGGAPSRPGLLVRSAPRGAARAPRAPRARHAGVARDRRIHVPARRARGAFARHSRSRCSR
jgi:hypothetical protein